MKKLFLFLFSLLLFVTITPYASAQTSVNLGSMPTPTPVDYTLPYPGLLPDNFLYPLKMVRDRVVGFMISDPLKKAQFDLLQSDKRLAAGWELFTESPQKQSLGMDTIAKGDSYFAQGLSQLSLAKAQGLDIGSMAQQFYLSAQKHIEILGQMNVTSNAQMRQAITKESKQMQQFVVMVNKLKMAK